MSVGAFTDRKHQPTDAEIRKAIGLALPLWQALLHDIREQYPAQADFKFLYGQNYGWAWRFRIKGQLLTSLYPAQGCFKAQVNLSPEAVEATRDMPLGDNARRAVDGAHPYPEGRWIFIPVESERDLDDVRRLLALRAESKRLLKSRS